MVASDGQENDKKSIPIFRRKLHELEVDRSVIVEYQSNRGNKRKKSYKGTITRVKPTASDKCKFWFYDPEAERKIEVHVSGTLEESKVKSQKTDAANTVGRLICVIVSDESKSDTNLEQEYLMARRAGDFNMVVAAAGIQENKKKLEWMKHGQG